VSNNIDRRAELLKKSGKWKASDKKHLEDKIYKAKHEIEAAISSAERTKDISGDSFVIDTRLDDKISSIESLSNEIANEYSSMESSSLNSYQSEDTSGQKTQKVGELVVNITEKPREYQFMANKETDLFSSSIPANIEIASDPYKEDYMKNYGVNEEDIAWSITNEKNIIILRKLADAEVKRADAEVKRADAEVKRADAEVKNATDEVKKIDAIMIQIAQLRKPTGTEEKAIKNTITDGEAKIQGFKRAADDAKRAANDAKTAADNAKTAADDAKTAADDAKTAIAQIYVIDDAKIKVNDAKTAADNAETAADDAKTAADDAKIAADDAKIVADDAKTEKNNIIAFIRNFIADEQKKPLFGNGIAHIDVAKCILPKSIDLLLNKNLLKTIREFALVSGLINTNFKNFIEDFSDYKDQLILDTGDADTSYTTKDYLTSKMILQILANESILADQLEKGLYVKVDEKNDTMTGALRVNFPRIRSTVSETDFIKKYILHLKTIKNYEFYNDFVPFILYCMKNFNDADNPNIIAAKNMEDIEKGYWSDIFSNYKINRPNYFVGINNAVFIKQKNIPPPSDDDVFKHVGSVYKVATNGTLSQVFLNGRGMVEFDLPAAKIIDYYPLYTTYTNKKISLSKAEKKVQLLNDEKTILVNGGVQNANLAQIIIDEEKKIDIKRRGVLISVILGPVQGAALALANNNIEVEITNQINEANRLRADINAIVVAQNQQQNPPQQGQPANLIPIAPPVVVANVIQQGPVAAQQQQIPQQQGQPVVAQGQPVVANGQPVVANGQPVVANGQNQQQNLIPQNQQQALGGADPPVDSSRNLTSFNQAIIVGAITMILVLIWSLFGSSKTATSYDRTTYDAQIDYYDQLDYDETYNSQINGHEYYNYENHDGDGSYYYDDDSTDYNGYYNAETYGDNNGQYQSEYDEKNNDYVSNNYKNLDLDFIKYDQYGHGYAYYADLY
jgi:hypothetical protein